MTIRKRLERLESTILPIDERPLVMMTRLGMTRDDVIAMSTGPGCEPVMRKPGEAYEELRDRARPLLATPWAGMPIIMCCVYSDTARAQGKEQAA